MKLAMTKVELIEFIKSCERTCCEECVFDFYCDEGEQYSFPDDDVLIIEPFQDVKVVD